MELCQTLRLLAGARIAVVPRYPTTLAPRFLSTTRTLQSSEPPRPRAPWQKPSTKPSLSSVDKLRQSLRADVRPWDSIVPPRPPKGDNAFGALSRSPLLAGRRKDLLDSDDPTSVYGLMGHDMGLEDSSRNLFSEGDFLSRHSKAAQAPEMRLRPSTGRIVKVHNKVDFSRGLRQLDVMMKINKVALDFRRQRFHERPGLKRKRQKSQRWRARFRQAFFNTVGRVNELRRQGW